jgi:hypothetical protein
MIGHFLKGFHCQHDVQLIDSTFIACLLQHFYDIFSVDRSKCLEAVFRVANLLQRRVENDGG